MSENKRLEWEEYKALANRTVANVSKDYFTHSIVGFTTEGLEFFTASSMKNAIEEIGDFIWYVAMLSNRVRREFPFVITDETLKNEFIPRYDIDSLVYTFLFNKENRDLSVSSSQSFLRAIGLLADQTKRVTFYGAKINERVVENNLSICLIFISNFVSSNNLDIRSIMFDNIEKLKKRFPEKFTQKDALNRDVEHELSHIEDDTTRL